VQLPTSIPPGGEVITTDPSGTPYTYYVIYSSTTNSPFPELPKAAQLGIDAVNSSGGINGHPMRLKTCPVNLDLNKAASCAREAVGDQSVIAADVWLLLGLGAGRVFALVGQGLVVIYRGSGVLNFAPGPPRWWVQSRSPSCGARCRCSPPSRWRPSCVD